MMVGGGNPLSSLRRYLFVYIRRSAPAVEHRAGLRCRCIAIRLTQSCRILAPGCDDIGDPLPHLRPFLIIRQPLHQRKLFGLRHRQELLAINSGDVLGGDGNQTLRTPFGGHLRPRLRVRLTTFAFFGVPATMACTCAAQASSASRFGSL